MWREEESGFFSLLQGIISKVAFGAFESGFFGETTGFSGSLLGQTQNLWILWLSCFWSIQQISYRWIPTHRSRATENNEIAFSIQTFTFGSSPSAVSVGNTINHKNTKQEI